MKEISLNREPSPLFFRDILGQERVLSYLKAALNQGRLAHAYLFLGPEGVGKESVADGPGRGLKLHQPPGGRRRLRALPLLQAPGRRVPP